MSAEQVTPEELAAIPEGQRAVIARWLVQRSEQFQPSMMLSAQEAMNIRSVLQGSAVDLYAPLTEDSTTAHAVWVLSELGLHP